MGLGGRLQWTTIPIVRWYKPWRACKHNRGGQLVSLSGFGSMIVRNDFQSGGLWRSSMILLNSHQTRLRITIANILVGDVTESRHWVAHWSKFSSHRFHAEMLEGEGWARFEMSWCLFSEDMGKSVTMSLWGWDDGDKACRLLHKLLGWWCELLTIQFESYLGYQVLSGGCGGEPGSSGAENNISEISYCSWDWSLLIWFGNEKRQQKGKIFRD